MGKPTDRRRPKKRKFQGNQHTNCDMFSDRDDSVSGESKSCSEESARGLSSSARKIPLSDPQEMNEGVTESNKSNVSGYRFIDMEVLSELFEQMPCKECGEFKLMFAEDSLQRKGCASSLRIACENCGWKYCFYSSKKVKHYFEVNRRLVYAMRTIGKGASSAKRFCAIMNMPPPRLSQTLTVITTRHY